ncbi:macro domain-containing protein [Paenibacillus sp. NPDC058177]|uniref:macro domain-containing protein n=1 Tax=Paenibacillus sp. NPDC058177 TaxID=3346369 RepID=UPI0036DA59C1
MNRWKAYFSVGLWKLSFRFKKFLSFWLAAFSVIWTFTEFSGYYFTVDGSPWKPSVWVVIGLGIVVAIWMSRPLLRRKVLLPDHEVLLEIDVNNLYARKDGSWIIPCNCCFLHSHIDEQAIIVQFRNRFFSSPSEFDQVLAQELQNIPYELDTVRGNQVKKYPIGTVIQIQLHGIGQTVYLLATSELNPQGKGNPNLKHLEDSLKSLWTYIAEHGNTEPIIIPVLGSGRHRLVISRYVIIGMIVRSFIAGLAQRKFTKRLTIVMQPKAFIDNRYNLDDIESYFSSAGKFEC